MRSVRFALRSAAALAVAVVIMTPRTAEARCYTFQESHNGTDLFNIDGGAKEAARIKLMESIELWRQQKKLKNPRVGKISYRCDPWNMDYLLPHHRCYAKARACY